MPFFEIYAGLSGGFGGANYIKTEEYNSFEEAEEDARNLAIEDYQSYEGCHGITSKEDIWNNLADYGLDENATDEEIEVVYNEEIESWIDYKVKEVKTLN